MVLTAMYAVVQELQRTRAQCALLVTRVEREMAEGTRPFIEELTPFSFLYEPHTVTALTFALIGLCYVAFFHPDGTFEDSIKLCVVCCNGVCVCCNVAHALVFVVVCRHVLWRYQRQWIDDGGVSVPCILRHATPR